MASVPKEIAGLAWRRSCAVSDGLAYFTDVKEAGCQHVTGGALNVFYWVNMMIGNVKKSINGAYYVINHKHLSRYLAEFCNRFNRRLALENMLPRFCYVAARTPSMPMRLLRLAELYG